MINLSRVFTDEQKTAIDILLRAGFVAFADTKIDDTRELGTDRRTRTFRHQRRYAMVLALRDEPAAGDEAADAEAKSQGEMNKAELVAEIKRRGHGKTKAGATKAELLAFIAADDARRRFDAP